MTLREKQSLFVQLVAHFISYIHQHGYELTFGDAFRDSRCTYGQPFSLHRERLAIDLNLFLDGKYLSSTEDWALFGAYWKTLHPDCRWGGDFKDGNHFSLTPDGERA